MAADDLLRLAWEVDRDGRRRLRDSLLTLAVLESGPDDAVWADRCRARLIAHRPEHYLGEYPTIREALEDPRVLDSRDRLRVKHPSLRVERLLFAHRACRGPFTGRPESIAAMVEDLTGLVIEPDHVRRDAPQPTRGPLARSRAARPSALHLAFTAPADRHGSSFEPGSSGEVAATPAADPADFARFYLGVLLAIACLLASIEAGQGEPADG